MKLKHFVLIAAAGLVVILDECVKKIALDNYPFVHKNTGIAFDLPLWPWIATTLVIVIASGLIVLAFRKKNEQPWLSAAAMIIVIGALGNLIDRFVYGFIVDYIVFSPTNSAFNLSDLTIIVGLLIFFLSKRKS